MDQELKQRLVGAVVITALAAIFVPMLFDDPVSQSGRQINELDIPAVPKALLDQQRFTVPESTDAVINLPQTEPLKTVTAPEKNRTQLQKWFLQAGLFSQQKNAEALRDKLRQQGLAADVKKVTEEQNAMYKVLVGPELNKDRAQMVKKKLEMMKINSFITQE